MEKNKAQVGVNNQQEDWTFKFDNLLHVSISSFQLCIFVFVFYIELFLEFKSRSHIRSWSSGYSKECFRRLQWHRHGIWTNWCGKNFHYGILQNSFSSFFPTKTSLFLPPQTGGSQNYKYRGIIPRAMGEIFQAIQDRSESAITVRISYVFFSSDI